MGKEGLVYVVSCRASVDWLQARRPVSLEVHL